MAAPLTRLLNSWFEILLRDIAVKNVYIFQLETQAKVKISGNDVINDVGQQTISLSRTLKKTRSNAIVTNLRNIEKCLTFFTCFEYADARCYETDNSANNLKCICFSTALLLEYVNQSLFEVS